MTIEEMKARKIELGYSNREISELSGIPEVTVQKIFSGKTKAPRKESIKRLEHVLQKNDYTVDDYLALPDDQRVELIDGVFYDMDSPQVVHQIITGFIHNKLLDHVSGKNMPCLPLVSPMDVQLDMDNKTMLQPDVLVICGRDKIKNGRIFGAPDLAVEVLSPSTRKKDMTLKLYKYSNAGVREYWMVDTDGKSVVVYDLEHDAIPKIYGIHDRIPVLIWNGEYEIDMDEMFSLYGDWIE